ncbi:MAG: class II aldolase/adducin family protein [Victivallaceae bacterium]|nr:class II aldolase/adducin family protein [Victivallaceae bacterium]
MHELQAQYQHEIEQLACVSAQCGHLGFVTSHGGNLSSRTDGNVILITPTKVPKSEIVFEDIVIVDPSGKILYADAKRKPTGETPMHTTLYRKRPDLTGLIHAHPPILTGFAMTSSNLLARPLLPEPILELGAILSVDYAEPVSEALAQSFAPVVYRSNAWLMRNHGITIGSPAGPKRALELLQMAEAMAKSICTAYLIGGAVQEIPESEVRNLEKVLSARDLPFPGGPNGEKSLTGLFFGD